MLKPAVAVLPIGRACGKAFGSRRLEEAVKARNGPLNRWRAQLKVGDRLDVMDNDARRAKRGDLGRWCEAVLVGCTEKGDRKWWTVHFRGWDARFDEEIDADHAERFLPPYSSVEDWRTNLEEGDEIEVRRPGDHGDARTYWFQGRVVSVAKDGILRMQVLDRPSSSSRGCYATGIAREARAHKAGGRLTLNLSRRAHVRRHGRRAMSAAAAAAISASLANSPGDLRHLLFQFGRKPVEFGVVRRVVPRGARRAPLHSGASCLAARPRLPPLIIQRDLSRRRDLGDGGRLLFHCV